ncbi:MAG TPA: thioredoxin domain-containing protein [Gemmatimonadales bacterium]|jgi:protein-disulfide isomerase|nr:thioredoxin domain-containing protein [Gemmatimonadales bacterium]
MKRFYLLLGVVAVVAIGFLYYSANQQPGGPSGSRAAAVPVTAQDSAFPGYLLGPDSAPVKVVEFVDYECPICAMFATVQFPTIRDQLIKTGKVQWRLRDYPLPPTTHRWSHLAADAVACASEQGKAWEMVDALFNTHDWALQSSNPTSVFRGLAQGVGINTTTWDACVSADRYAGRIQASLNQGDALGVGGTPTIFIDGNMLKERPTSDLLQHVVDSLIAARSKKKK